MIQNDFFATQYTKGFNSSDIVYEATQNLTSLNAYKQYIMGYIPYDEIPDFIKPVSFSVSEDGENIVYHFDDKTKIENIAWGFVSAPFTNQSYGFYEQVFSLGDSNFEKELNGTYSSENFSFLNSLKLRIVGTSDQITFHFAKIGENFNTYSFVVTFDNFMKFCNGDYDITVDGTSVNISDFSENGIAEKDGYKIFIYDYFIPNLVKFGGGFGTLRYDTFFSIQPFFIFNVEIENETKTFLVIPTNHINQTYYYGLNTNNNTLGWNKFIHFDMFRCALRGEFSKTELLNIPNGTDSLIHDTWVYRNGQEMRFKAPIKPQDLKKYLLMFPVWYRNTTNVVYDKGSYSDDTILPLFNNDDSPKFDFTSGKESGIKDLLRPWQYENNSINVNDFTVEDIPPYTPPEPEPEESDPHFLGDIDIISGFGGVVHVGLSTAQTTFLFEKLNTLPNLLDSIKNYFSPTGNINDYILNAKIFPFNVLGEDYGNVLQIGFDAQNTISFSGSVASVARTYRLPQQTIQIRKTNEIDFFNYEPYTNVYLKVPYCTEIELPLEIVSGNTVTIDYIVDLFTGVLGVYVVCNNKIIGFTTGKIGIDILRASIDTQTYNAKIANSAISAVGSLGVGTVSALTGNVGGVVSGLQGFGGSVLSGASAKTGIQTAGYTGDFSGALDSIDTYVRYFYVKPIVPERFIDTSGYIDFQTRTLSDCSGFTQCYKPIIDFDCTETEAEEIKRLLENGIYIE